MPGTEAFVSLVTNDSYALGAIALGRSLRNTGTLRGLALLITNDVSHDMRDRLSRLWDELVLVEELDSGDLEHLALLTRPELGVTFSKIHAWRLTQYTKCVFLDADTMVLQNVDELFDREEISAAPDIGWPDCFNSGVFVFVPSLDTFKNLLDSANQRGSFDGGDQGLLNSYWSDWATKDIKHHLPFIYNVTPNITYGYAPAFQRFGHNIKIIHFIGPNKPWQHRYLPEVDSVILFPGTYASEHAAQDFIKRWWQLYMEAEPRHYQSFDWSSPSTPSHYHHTHSWGAPPPSYHKPFTAPHITTHSHHFGTRHPTLWVTTNNPTLTPIYSYSASHNQSDIIYSPSSFYDSRTRHGSFTHHTAVSPLDHKSVSDTKTTALRPAYLTLPYPDHHSHTSLSFYSPIDMLGDGADTLVTEPNSYMYYDVDSHSDYQDEKEFTSSIYRRLSAFFDDDIVPPLRICYPYHHSSNDLYINPPTSAYSSLNIEFPSSFAQSDYNFVPDVQYYHFSPDSQTSHSNIQTNDDNTVNIIIVSTADNDITSTEGDAITLPSGTHVTRSVSPVHSSLLIQEDEELTGAVKLSDSVLSNVNVSPLPSPTPSTHAHPPPTLTVTPPDHESDPSTESKSTGEGATGMQEMYSQSGPVETIHQTNFEHGHFDFNGQDSFENIQAHIDKMMNGD